MRWSLCASLLLCSVLGIVPRAWAQTTVRVQWQPGPSGHVLAYRVYRDDLLQIETPQLEAIINVVTGQRHRITVASFGEYDSDGNGSLDAVGEGIKSPATIVGPTPTHQFGFRGCYVDDVANRALPTLLSSTGVSSGECVKLARQAGVTYAGVQWGVECWGGGSLAYAMAPVTECNMPCAASPGEWCGGSRRNSIYDVRIPATPTGVRVVP